MNELLLTTHQRRERARLEAQTLAPERTVLGRPLVHAIRYALDAALPADVAWLEAQRDTEGETLLASLRGRLSEFAPGNWADLRRWKPHVWRVLRDWMGGHAALCPEVTPCAS